MSGDGEVFGGDLAKSKYLFNLLVAGVMNWSFYVVNSFDFLLRFFLDALKPRIC